MSDFDLLDDAMMNDGFGSDNFDLAGVSLNLDDYSRFPPDDIDQSIYNEFSQGECRGIKQGNSWDELARVVSDDSEGDITKSERDELQEFLRDVGVSESPPPPPTFECWGAAISPVSEEQKIEPLGVGSMPDSLPMESMPPLLLGSMPYPYYDSASDGWHTMPPEKRRRMMPPPYSYHPVTPPAPYGDHVAMPPLTPDAPPLSMSSPPQGRTPALQRNDKAKGKGTSSNKNRTTRQYVPFEEMQRLMAQYGPIKTPRKRKIKGDDENGAGCAKQESIKRKFYRWFPDFEERFIRNPDGMTYRPKAGHDKEVVYRRNMRDMDQEILVHKRKVGRNNFGGV
ncbi:hypothetical protein ACHAXN_006636 [Cyclotella atomus]